MQYRACWGSLQPLVRVGHIIAYKYLGLLCVNRWWSDFWKSELLFPQHWLNVILVIQIGCLWVCGWGILWWCLILHCPIHKIVVCNISSQASYRWIGGDNNSSCLSVWQWTNIDYIRVVVICHKHPFVSCKRLIWKISSQINVYCFIFSIHNDGQKEICVGCVLVATLVICVFLLWFSLCCWFGCE